MRALRGARHFHKALLSLPIPSFDASDPLHARLVALYDEAQALARLADTTQYFQLVRRVIRSALYASGTGQRIDSAVADLLDSKIADSS